MSKRRQHAEPARQRPDRLCSRALLRSRTPNESRSGPVPPAIAGVDATLYGRAGIGEAIAWPLEPPRHGPVAQWLEPAAHNGLVGGSSPPGPTNNINGL
jgi:hypothetical protein